MFEKIKNVIKSNTNSKEKKPNKVSFGGYTEDEIKDSIKNPKTDALFNPLKNEELSELNKNKPTVTAPMKIALSSSSFSEIIATIYSEGDTNGALAKLRTYLNEHKGNVDKRFWYMLMDTYEITSNQVNFEKAADAFAQSFDASPPSWDISRNHQKKSVMTGKNILILEPILKTEQTQRFKEFFKASKQEKFCRINVSQCKFDQSDISVLHHLYQLFVQLRKSNIMSVLMGDNNIISFCKSYINPNLSNKSLKSNFIEQEELFWLIYLEILQWKGKNEEFEDLAFEYAKKFEISPPGWESNGIMLFEKEESENEDKLDKILSSNNINNLLDIIKNDFENNNKSEIELSSVDRIDFASAGAISHFIQELKTENSNNTKEVIFKHPNEMILTLLEMVGVTEFVKIIPRDR